MKHCLLILLFFTSVSSFAQNWSFVAGPGVSQYLGDVTGQQIGNSRLALNVEGWYRLTDHLQLKSGISFYGIRGQDADTTRLRSFKSGNFEFYSSAMYSFKRGYFTPFAYAGLGATTLRPQGESRLGYWDLRDVQPEGQKVPGIAAMIPFGVGLEYEITPVVSVVFDLAFRYALSDQLDAVGQEIVNVDALSPTAIDYYESLSEGMARQVAENSTMLGGNSGNNDWYSLFSVKIKYTPSSAIFGCINPYKYDNPGRRNRRKIKTIPH